MFEAAARLKFRFPSSRGALSAEQLFDVPLQSKDGFDLDTIAKAVNAELKAVSDESFVVKSKPNAEQQRGETKLELVKYVIKYKLDQIAEREEAAKKADTRHQLMDVLARKQAAALEGLTEDEIKAKLAAL